MNWSIFAIVILGAMFVSVMDNKVFNVVYKNVGEFKQIAHKVTYMIWGALIMYVFWKTRN
jgi:uncharacterized membrane protein YuzA (DUF378 family)